MYQTSVLLQEKCFMFSTSDIYIRGIQNNEQRLMKRDGKIIFLNINVKKAELLFDLEYVNIHFY